MSRIGDKIKKARLEKKMELKSLAKLCGVSESYLSGVESGKKVLNDSMIKKISNVLNVSLEESLYVEEEIKEEPPKVVREAVRRDEPVKRVSMEEASPGWQSAFSNIIKDIPVYNIDMNEIKGYKHLPVMEKKVEGYNPEKLIYVLVPDNSLSGFRLKKGDRVMVVLNHEIYNNGLCLLEYNGKKAIRLARRLDGDRIMLLSHRDEVRGETVSIKEVKILGHCVKAEIDLGTITQ